MYDKIIKKLEVIEERLTRLEDRKNIIEEEKVEVAPPGELQSVEEAQVDDGTVTTRKIPYCECGNKLEDFSLCHVCKKKLCDGCSAEFRNKRYCSEDLLKRLPITMQSFKVLLCIGNNIENENEVHIVTSISRKDIKDALGFLKKFGYVEASFLGKKSITDFGLECLSAWGQFYGGSDEMAHLDNLIRRYILGY